jgi:hypothetical protein
MTITHEANGVKIGFQISANSVLTMFVGATTAVFRRLQHWHREAIHVRTTATLPEHLKRDIGEIDHLPATTPTFIQSEPSSYQDRLQQMWLR